MTMAPRGPASLSPTSSAHAETEFITRFSSRTGRLSHVFLKDRLAGAKAYDRIAGYFRSSIFELVHEDISAIERVRIICNSDLDPRDVLVAQASDDTMRQTMIERWNSEENALDSLLERGRYKRLYDILKAGNVEIRVVSREDAPFLHGKAGVVTRADGTRSAFMGSMNETAQGWAHSYEIVWEDRSPDGAAWVSEEFEHLWRIGRPLPQAIVEEIGRCAEKVQVRLSQLPPDAVGQSALVESPLYRRGEGLMPWQQAFVSLFIRQRAIYGKARFLLADEVGVGKTLSLATAALVSALLGDGPVLVLCPATLGQQWQTELMDKLNVPTGLWLSSAKVWQDPQGRIIRTRGAEDIARCPFRIGIVSTGLITQDTDEVQYLLRMNFGMLILDEAHKAERSRSFGREPRDVNLMRFMMKAAARARHVVLSTATPIQKYIDELWDLMEILNQGADHVLGRIGSPWREPSIARPILTGETVISDEFEAWNLLRNPLPPRDEDNGPFDLIYSDLGIDSADAFTSQPLTALDAFTREDLTDLMRSGIRGMPFFRYHNPISRHVVLRRRKTLEERGLMKRIAVDIFPTPGDADTRLFDGKALRTSREFDAAYEAVEKFTQALSQRSKAAVFMKNLLRQRLCSSITSGIMTCERLMADRMIGDTDGEDEFDYILQANPEVADGIGAEIAHLETALFYLRAKSTDPKLDACIWLLDDRGWIEQGTIIFSQYYDTARWVGESLSRHGPFSRETVAVYAGQGRSGVLLEGEWRTVDREEIKKAVRDRRLRLVVATDAACEGLNLQALGNMINVDLPWNPSRLEQRIGRIKRFGQLLDRVRMANLVYQGTVDERVYERLSARMKDRYDLLGSLPDTIDDEWIEDLERMEEELRDYTNKRKSAADVFELRYGNFVEAEGQDWALCREVLDRDEADKMLATGW